MKGGITPALKEQAKAVMVMMALAIVSVLAMIVLGQFKSVMGGISALGNGSIAGTTNYTAQVTVDLFVAAFALFGSFASITALIILVKAIIGVVKGMN